MHLLHAAVAQQYSQVCVNACVHIPVHHTCTHTNTNTYTNTNTRAHTHALHTHTQARIRAHAHLAPADIVLHFRPSYVLRREQAYQVEYCISVSGGNMGFLDMGSKSDAYKCKNCNKNFKEPIKGKSGKCKACRTKEDKEEDDEESSKEKEKENQV